MNNQLKRFLKYLLVPISYVNKIIPKNRKNILIYSNLGFRDNIKTLYDYMIDNNYNEKYKIICSLDDYKKYKGLNIKNVKFINNYLGLFYYLTSKYCFYSFGKYPIKPSKQQLVVNLWHGMPLKKIGNLEKETKYEDYNYFTYVIATSPFFGDIMKQAFKCDDNQIFIAGQPRNDELFLTNNLSDKLKIDKYEKKIMWLPTFRKSSRLNMNNTMNIYESELNFPLIDSIKKMEDLNELLKFRNSVLIIKPHPMQDLNSSDLRQYSNIRIIDQNYLLNNDISLYNLLKEADALITDYSSVYFDYLLLDRPIGFTVNDINDYKDARGFIIDDPIEIMPGNMIEDFKSFKNFIINVLDEKDIFSDKRQKINDICNYHKNGGFCEYILEFCNIKIEE